MNVYETVTANIINAIEQGAGEFRMPWHRATTADAMPCNAATGSEYRGSNVLTLWATAMGKGYGSNRWATYKQWAAMGAQVRKGEKAAVGIYYNVLERDNADTGDVDKIPFARPFFVFNAEQVDGYAMPDAAPRVDQTTVNATADAAVAATGAKVTHSGTRAFYRPSTDEVYMPPRDAFIGTATSNPTEAYYSTLLHELTHWTGHDSRLARDPSRSKRFGDEAYAGEELVAELGAAFLCARLNITIAPRVDHAQYIASWLKVLKSDNRAVIRAASDAQKAADYILAASQSQTLKVAA